MSSEAFEWLGKINKGEYTPESNLLSFDDGSQLANDPSGIGWYILTDAGGTPLRPEIDTDPKLRRDPRHRMPR